MLESPGYSVNMAYAREPWKSAFNWTMTYRLDSDIPIPYGKVQHTAKNKTKSYLSIAKSKKKSVAWFVSNCETGSQRERYVDELSKYVQVDRYGRCGNRTCIRNVLEDDKTCQKMLNETYLFYLSFENNFCVDYFTEKLYNVLELDVVPVVRGGMGNDPVTSAIKNWYIDSRDYTSPKALAKYLLYLKNNPVEYVKYLSGKDSYDFVTYYGLRKLPQWCELCERLHNATEPRQVIRDITKWWNTSNCVPPTDISY
jgi:hypothetical protein